MKNAHAPRQAAEIPLQTAARLREKHGVILSAVARKPLPGAVFDAMWSGGFGNPARAREANKTTTQTTKQALPLKNTSWPRKPAANSRQKTP